MKELFTLYYHRRILFTDFFSQSQIKESLKSVISKEMGITGYTLLEFEIYLHTDISQVFRRIYPELNFHNEGLVQYLFQ